MDTGSMAVEMGRQETYAIGSGGYGCGGKGARYETQGANPFGFIGATGVRKPTARLDLRACHDLPQRHTMGYVHTIPILSPWKTRRTFRLPGRATTRYE